MISRLSLISFLALAGPVLANGGGYIRGGLGHAGDITQFEPQEVEKIRMVDELLTVELRKKEAGVEIRYVMKNTTDSKVKVRFGFPVEELPDVDLMGGEDAGSAPKKDKLKYCTDYVVTARGKQIAAKWQPEAAAADGAQTKGIAGWLVSELAFGPGEEMPVQISFRSSYPAEQWDVSDDSSTSASTFKYRLSTAACWAGTIGTGRIILKPVGIDPRDLKVLKPVNRFKKEGDNWVWNFENLEPSMADDLEIEASPSVRSYYREGGLYEDRGGSWTMYHANYTATASSTLAPEDGKTYTASHVKEQNGDQVWSEGAAGPGIGEWLELRPEAPKPLTAITIIPGFAKDGLFKANARPKKMKVELNGSYRFSVDVPDSPEPFEFPVKDYTKAVKVIRFTFEDVWKGEKYEDLCVSGISLKAKLDKEPKISPQR